MLAESTAKFGIILTLFWVPQFVHTFQNKFGVGRNLGFVARNSRDVTKRYRTHPLKSRMLADPSNPSDRRSRLSSLSSTVTSPFIFPNMKNGHHDGGTSLDQLGTPIECKHVAEVESSSEGPLALDPSALEIVELSSTKNADNEEFEADSVYPFVNMLRGSANYIAEHSGELAVIHIPGELLEKKGFSDLMDDIALTWLLGMKVVIVVGCRHQVECRLDDYEYGYQCHNSLRVIDDKSLRVVEEEAGFVRFEVERQLNRFLRLHGGINHNAPGGPPAPDGNVVGGNFYTCRAYGEGQGVDYQHTGYPCHTEVEKIKAIHKNNDIVLLTAVGMDRLGEMIHVNSESLASFVAGSLKASKIIYCSDQNMILRNKVTKKSVKNFQLSFAKRLLQDRNIKVHKRGFASFDEDALSPDAAGMLLQIGWAASALEMGVTRAHIIGPTNGSLLEELFTAKEGSSACISQDAFESIHPDDEFDDGEFDGTFFQNFMQPAIMPADVSGLAAKLNGLRHQHSDELVTRIARP